MSTITTSIQCCNGGPKGIVHHLTGMLSMLDISKVFTKNLFGNNLISKK